MVVHVCSIHAAVYRLHIFEPNTCQRIADKAAAVTFIRSLSVDAHISVPDVAQ